MTDENNHRRPSLPSLVSTSSSQSARNTTTLPNRDSRRLSSAEPIIMARPPRNRSHRSDPSNPPDGMSSTVAAPGTSFSQAALEGEEREERRHNRLGYQRTTVACSHCRRRKIRCEPSEGDLSGRCVKCIKWDKECIFEAAESATVARPSRRRGEPNSESPSNSATSINLHEPGQFEPSPQDPDMHSASPHGYPYGEAHPPWFQPFTAPRLGYSQQYGTGVSPYPSGGGMSALDPVSSYSTSEEQMRRYPIHYQHGQPSTAMLESGGRVSPGSSYVTSTTDGRWDGLSQRPGMYPGYANPPHMYSNLTPHDLSGHQHHTSAFSQAPPLEGVGSMPTWTPLPSTSMPGSSRQQFVNGNDPSWGGMPLRYEQYQGSPQHQYQR